LIEQQKEQLFLAIPKIDKVAVIGSFMTGTSSSLAGEESVDVSVTMPSAMFDPQGRDALNGVYFWKRALFLARIAAHLQEKLPVALEFVAFRGHVLKPLLILRSKTFKVVLHTAIGMDLFKRHRFAPSRNNVREAAGVPSLGLSDQAATPLYNSLLVMDMLPMEHLKLVHGEIKRFPQLKGAIVHLKRWLAARCLDTSVAPMPSALQLTFVLAWMSKNGHLSEHLSDWQILRIFFLFVAQQDWAKVLFFGKSLTEGLAFLGPDTQALYTTDSFKEQFEVSLVEPVAGMNVFFDVTLDAMLWLSKECRTAKVSLEESKEDLFVKIRSPLAIADLHFTLLPGKRNDPLEGLSLIRELTRTIKRALGLRISDLLISKTHDASFSLLLWLNPSEAFSLVDLGPLNTKKAACKEFRDFWQDRSELRRFKDGTIREAVPWDDYASKRQMIVPAIVQWAAAKERVTVSSVEGNGLLEMLQQETFHSNATAVRTAWDELSKAIQGLKELPLAITRSECIGASLRGTSPFLSLNSKQEGMVPIYTPVIEAILYLESSTKWPQDQLGFLYAKQAFVAQLGCLLRDHGYDVSVSEGLYLDVMQPQFRIKTYAPIFRLYLHSGHQDRELRLSVPGREQKMERVFEHGSRHAKAIAELATRFRYFAPLVRLVKCYLAKLRIQESMFSLEAIELLCAKIFTEENAPQSLTSAIYRVFALLASVKDIHVFFDQDSNSRVNNKREKGLRITAHYPDGVSSSFWTDNSELSQDNCRLIAIQAESLIYEFPQSEEDLLHWLQETVVIPSDAKLCLEPSMVSKRSHQPLSLSKLSLRSSTTIAKQINGSSFEARHLKFMPGFDSVSLLVKDIREAIPIVSIRYDDLKATELLIFCDGCKKKDIEKTIETIERLAGDMIVQANP